MYYFQYLIDYKKLIRAENNLIIIAIAAIISLLSLIRFIVVYNLCVRFARYGAAVARY